MPDIKDFEAMAMLDLSETERALLSTKLTDLTRGFETLERIDTKGVEPLVTVIDMHNVMREDIPVKLMPREEILANAPEQYDGYFQVPGTLD